ncbi:Aminotransferase class-III [Carpediemonas membranifera]|uniref:Ornithine aminotransferase n=1 Tax=Carpediemonas membranifera TaxID=201153 RepID=A0A8J6B4U2_9EUKA|nr:Aminotransferase class-III [Carpediemonas membranifera]|eukprot:KAG9393029.1 Aminotransferase class-III [Carpediemonas membranifera]
MPLTRLFSHPLPVVFESAKGVEVTDPEGKKYIDCLAAYSAVNQGHCHPKIVQAMIDQAQKLTLSSRAFYTNQLGPFCEYLTKFFGYESALMANSGVEAVETALKLARAWGYKSKGIPENQGLTVCCDGNFHGRTLGVITMSSDPDCREPFGPFNGGFLNIPYDNLDAAREVFEKFGDRINAFIAEPIQGEAGIFVPHDDFLPGVHELCKKHNCLFIMDEVQTGIARTGKLLATEYVGIKPDVVVLGKALSGGVVPVSAILSSKEIMHVGFTPGSHGSTFGGNPVSCAVARAALEVVKEEKLAERAMELGEYFREKVRALNSPHIELVRGRGLLNAVIIKPIEDKTAWHVCLLLKEHGVLAKPTHNHIIRFAPPLVITKEQINHVVEMFAKSLEEYATLKRTDIPGYDL